MELASLFNVGLGVLADLNTACGSPLLPSETGPWHCFSGLLFHRKMALAASGSGDPGKLLNHSDGDRSSLGVFLAYKRAILAAIKACGGQHSYTVPAGPGGGQGGQGSKGGKGRRGGKGSKGSKGGKGGKGGKGKAGRKGGKGGKGR